MKNSLQFPGAAYQLCLDEAFRQLPFLIEGWCSKLLVFLEGRSLASPDAEKHQFKNAIEALKKNRVAIVQGFEREVINAVAKNASSTQGAATAGPARAFSALSFDERALTGDGKVYEAAEIARLQQFVSLVCEAGLSDFSASLSNAQGFQGVSVQSNSLRPEVIVQALYSVLQTFAVNNLMLRCWLTHGARFLGEELQLLYTGLNGFLTDQGVAPATHGVKASPEGTTAAIVFSTKAQGAEAASPDYLRDGFKPARRAENDEISRLESERPLTVENLHCLPSNGHDEPNQILLPWRGDGSEKTIGQDFSHTMLAASSVLTELQAWRPGGQKPAAVRMSPPQPVALLRERLKTAAKSLDQVLAIDVVGMMIEQITHDDRLLPPVRQIISNAEPAFLRVAASDPRFFSDKSHPARLLLDLMTSSSLGYAREDTPGFSSFLECLKETALHLTEEDASDAQHFATLLKEFECKLARHFPENRQSQQRAEQALLQAELRNLVAGKIAAEIKLRRDFIGGNRVIAAFVMGPWAQAMAHERTTGAAVNVVNPINLIKPANPEKSAYSLTLAELLWSADPAQASKDRKRLQRSIPGMLKSLREGLLLIEYPLEESRTFFVELMACHQAALKTPGKTFDALTSASPDATPQAGHAFGKAVAIDEGNVGDIQLWLAPTEIQHSGFMPDSVLSSLEPKANPPHPQTLETADTAVHARPQASVQSTDLQLGAWVEMLVDRLWLRAQLTWVSPHNTLFMFTSEKGRKHSMTARVLQHLIQQEFVRVISQDGVIDSALDHALESVAQAALSKGIRSD